MIDWYLKTSQSFIHADRNRLIDLVIDELLTCKLLLNIQSDNTFRDFIDQCTTLRRVKEINNLGIERFLWESTNGQDHYFFGLMYYWLARESKGSGAVFSSDKPKVQPIVATMDGFTMNMKEFLEDKYGD